MVKCLNNNIGGTRGAAYFYFLKFQKIESIIRI